MYRKIFCISIIFFRLIIDSLSINAQCNYTDKVKSGGDYGFVNYIHLCPTYQFAYGGSSSDEWNLMNKSIEFNKAPKEVFRLKDYVEKKIESYAGRAFFEKIKFKSVEVVYDDSLEKFIDFGRNVSLNYCKAKYFFYYDLKPDSLANYCIGIALNKEGRIISEFNFPSKRNYKSFDSTFTYCRLIEVAKRRQKSIEPIKEISLEYDKQRRKFYWLVVQDLIKEKQGVNYFNKVLIDASNLEKVTLRKGVVYVDY